MENPEKYVQTWNSRSKKYVLIKKGNGGKMTGKMQPEPFEGVEIVNPKPEPESAETDQPEKPQSGTSSKPGQNEPKEPEQKDEPEKKSGWASVFGF